MSKMVRGCEGGGGVGEGVVGVGGGGGMVRVVSFTPLV